ncbi:MAG: peptidoglycan binding domain-containing protein [Nocardioidaceae bacterium]
MRLWPRRKVYVDDLPKTHDLRFATAFLLGFVVLVASLYGVGYFLAGDRLPAGTRVAGVDVGGMRAGEARTVLQSELVPRIGRPVKATVAGFEFELDPQESGLTLDIDATIDEALGGGPWDPRHMLQVVTGGGDVTPVVVVDAAEMRAALERIQRRVKRAPVDAKVTFPGGLPQVRYAEVGRALSFGASASRASRGVAGPGSCREPAGRGRRAHYLVDRRHPVRRRPGGSGAVRPAAAPRRQRNDRERARVGLRTGAAGGRRQG